MRACLYQCFIVLVFLILSRNLYSAIFEFSHSKYKLVFTNTMFLLDPMEFSIYQLDMYVAIYPVVIISGEQ